MTTLSAVLASIFGHDTSRPIYAARFKLTGLWLGSLSVGLIIAKSLPGIAKASSFSMMAWLSTAMVISQIAVLFGLGASSSVIGAVNRLNLILGSLPLRKNRLGFFVLLPSLILALCSLTLVIPSLLVVCLSGGVNPVLLTASVCAGGWSAFGIAYAHPSRGICLAVAIAVVAGEYKILELLRASDDWALTVGLVAAIGLLGALALRAGSVLQSIARRPIAANNVSTGNFPVWMWFLKKLWRNAPFRRSFLVTVTLGLGLTLFVTKHGQLGSSLVALPVQLLAAALASDIRSTARSLVPPEIGVLRGALIFTGHSAVVALGAVTLALLPIKVTAVINGLPAASLLMAIVSGTAIGLLVGAWLTPRASDISAQLTANLACLCISLGASQLISERYTLPTHCALVFVALASTFLIEYKRNALIWRKHVT